MTATYIKIVVDPSGDNYTVPQSDLMYARVTRKVNQPSTFEFELHNPAGAKNALYEMDDKVDIYIDNNATPTTKVMTGTIEEQMIQRPRVGQTLLTCRGQDYLTVLSYRLARAGFPGAVDISTVLTNLLTEFASGEFTTTNVVAASINVTDFTVGTRKSILSIMRELAELPAGKNFDFYLDGSNDLHWHDRASGSYDSGVTLSGSNIRSFVSRRSTKDKKTFIHIYGAGKPTEEPNNTQNTHTDYVNLSVGHYADDFYAEHDYVQRISLYINKVGDPGTDFNGRICLAQDDQPGSAVASFTIREEDVSTTVGWHNITVDHRVQVGERYFIKLDKVGADTSNTYRWWGDTPAVLDTRNKAKTCTDTNPIVWVESDYDFTMKIFFPAEVEVSATDTATPKREAVVRVRKGVDDVQAQALADRLLVLYLQSQWFATVTADAPAVELKPGDLITLNETVSGLASKAYRMEQIDWEFGARGKAETVNLTISSILPYESLDEIYNRLIETLLGEGGQQYEELTEQEVYPALIGKAKVSKSAVGYVP